MKQIINYYTIKNFLFKGLTLLFFTSCTSTKNSVVWVNSVKSECSGGAGKMQCISIYRGETINDSSWELFYQNIDGFNFEPGYFKKIEIQEEHLDKSKVPADASSIKYVFIKTLDKKVDKRFVLNDFWISTSINGNSISHLTTLPLMEINLSKMQIFGSNGCNNYTGKIESITSSRIQFGNIASTKKMCRDMTISDMFDKALNKSVAYKLKNTELTFYDQDGNETINFMKVDKKRKNIAFKNKHIIN